MAVSAAAAAAAAAALYIIIINSRLYTFWSFQPLLSALQINPFWDIISIWLSAHAFSVFAEDGERHCWLFRLLL